MSRISPFHFVNAALLFGVVLSVSDALAQTLPTTGGGPTTTSTTLVYTACQQGQVNKCGTEPVRQNCTFTMQVDLNALTRSGGFKFGGETCTPVGSRDLFKDFYQDSRIGFCYMIPRSAADGSAVRKLDENGDPIETFYDESC